MFNFLHNLFAFWYTKKCVCATIFMEYYIGGFRLYEKDKKSKKGKRNNNERFIRPVLHIRGNASCASRMDVYKLVQT